jgi:hypothetical protein
LSQNLDQVIKQSAVGNGGSLKKYTAHKSIWIGFGDFSVRAARVPFWRAGMFLCRSRFYTLFLTKT